MSSDRPDGFLARWSRRKAQQRAGAVPAEPEVALPKAQPALRAGAQRLPNPAAPSAVPVPAMHAAGASQQAPAAALPEPAPAPAPVPTLQEAQALTPQSDFRPFVGREVPAAVRNLAMKKLFADPHFNVMDGLDTYIDDYSQPDPLPAAMLAQMDSARFLGLVQDTPAGDVADGAALPSVPESPIATAPAMAPATESATEPSAAPPDGHTDLQLQPDPAPAAPGSRTGPG